jgi:cytochrome c556
MKKVTWISGVAAVLMTAFAGINVASADGHLEGAVKARQAHMQLNGFFIGQLAAIAKGDVPYDAAAATGHAQNLLVLSKMDVSAFWPMGTGNDAMKGKTRAKPELWTTYPKVVEKAQALTAALEKMVGAAGTDLASLQAALGPVGDGCGGCHKPFRAEKF